MTLHLHIDLSPPLPDEIGGSQMAAGHTDHTQAPRGSPHHEKPLVDTSLPEEVPEGSDKETDAFLDEMHKYSLHVQES